MLGLDKNKRYLLACSYGPDSMALFDMLLKENYSFEVAHVNYHLRDESDMEMHGLSDYCNLHNVKLHVLDFNEHISKANLEAQCRDIRYNFFNSLFKGFDALLIAHNQDDLIETYIMQKRRQNIVMSFGIAAKIHSFGMDIIRPLLNYKKIDLLNYCKENGVPFSIDKTNLQDVYLRNKIRHEIVEKMNDKQRQEMIEKINSENKKMSGIKNRILASVDLSDVNQLLTLKNEEFVIALNMYVKTIDQSAKVSKSYCLEIKKALKSNKPNINFKINLYLTLSKEYNKLVLHKENGAENYSYLIEEPCKLDNEHFYLDFTKNSGNRNVKIEDYPITIRNANPNDLITIKDYLKPARRLFIDWKMPVSLRKKWPVIVNKENKVIYMPRYTKDFVITEDLNFYVK